MRWLILLHVDQIRPRQLTDMGLLSHIRESFGDVTQRELRRELDYLEGHGFLVITENSAVWHLKITSPGIDIVECTTPCPLGIGRPDGIMDARDSSQN